MAEGLLVGAIQFLDRLGIYDVVLPFLLIFTIVFAILEKTKVFGTEQVDGNTVPRRNLNAMTAFVTAFLVVASTNLVSALNEAVASIALLLVLAVSFLFLVGSFSKPEDMENGFFLDDGVFKWIFMVIMFIGVILIFLNSLKTESSYCYGGSPCSWLSLAWGWLGKFWTNEAFASLILILLIIGFIYYISGRGNRDPPPTPQGGGGDNPN